MVNLQTDGSAIKFTFTNSDHYLVGDGEITVPKNSLILVLDESDMVTFKKSDGDPFLSFLISESNFASKAELEEFFKTQMCAGNASSSIVNMYVGCEGDTCDPDTGEIHRTTCPKMDNLNIVYVDTTMHYSMVHVSLGEFILENEFEDGLYVDSGGTVHGQVDQRQEKVHTEYDASGNPITSADTVVLSVNASGFTASNIQLAIDKKTEKAFYDSDYVWDAAEQKMKLKYYNQQGQLVDFIDLFDTFENGDILLPNRTF